jgi:hypothetical protein
VGRENGSPDAGLSSKLTLMHDRLNSAKRSLEEDNEPAADDDLKAAEEPSRQLQKRVNR